MIFIEAELKYIELPEKKIEYYVDENGCHITTNCAITGGKHGGYPQLKIKVKEKWLSKNLSRILYERFVGPIPDGYVIRHKCDNPRCINIEHLIAGTHAQNVRDRVERGRSAIGEKNGRSKLTEQQVKEIKYIQSLNYTLLSYIYDVDIKVIRDIKNGKLWKHVNP